MDLGIENRVALVAGSSRGIGKSIAAELLKEGCRTCITGRDTASLEQTRLEFQDLFPPERIMAFAGDLTDAAVSAQAFGEIGNRWGAVDILVANLGSGRGQPGWDLDEEEWERLFRVNLLGGVRLARSAIRAMETRGGAIVFIASITAVEATAAPLPYSAAKAALVSYAKNLSRLVAGKAIRVNCVAPGNILFPGGSWERHLAQRADEVERFISSEVPLKRFGVPEEIAGLVAFLCSDRAAFITGSCFIADGGQTRRY